MSYELRWVELKKRERLFKWLFFLYLPGMGGVVFMMFLFVRLMTDYFLISCAVLWVGAIVVAGLRCLNWRCPRCAHPFSTKIFQNGLRLPRPFTERCASCGLWKWALRPNDGKYAPVKIKR